MHLSDNGPFLLHPLPLPSCCSMAPSTILHHLVEEDSGSSLPQSTTTYLRRLAKDEGMTLLREYGYAYQWAHRLCGVEHLVTDAEQDLVRHSSSQAVEMAESHDGRVHFACVWLPVCGCLCVTACVWLPACDCLGDCLCVAACV